MLASGNLDELAELCARVPTFLRMVHEMGFDYHPEVDRVRQKYSVRGGGDVREVNRSGGKELKKVLFHCDRQTMHTALEDLDDPDEFFPPSAPDQPDSRSREDDKGDAGDDDGDSHSLPPPPPPPPPNGPDDTSGKDDHIGGEPNGGGNCDNGDGFDDDGNNDGSGQPPNTCARGRLPKSWTASNSQSG